MRRGKRGLTAKTSLPELLNEHRGRPCRRSAPRLTIRQILAWADEHHRLHGCWPGIRSGDVPGAPGEKWANIDTALSTGGRGLRGGSTLARLLSERRGVQHPTERAPLTVQKIVAWAKSHHARTGSWPTYLSGDLIGVPGENWKRINDALQKGNRSLPGDTSLRRLLAETCGVRDRRDRPRLSEAQILAWADAHHRRTGRWPNVRAGEIHDAPGETWLNIHVSLRQGLRGLPGGSSLARLLAEHRGVRHRGDQPKLTIPLIMEWIDAHRRRTGSWPTRKSGNVLEAPGETWKRIENALFHGYRGLPGGLSLARVRNHDARIAAV